MTAATPARPQFLDRKLEAVESFLRFARGEELPRYPLDVFLEVSNVCDLKCAMCARFSALNPDRLSLIRSEARGFMEVDELERAFGEVLPYALSAYVFGYGEPTIHPRFVELLDFLGRYELLVEFFTNGMHLDEALVEQLVAHRVHRITLSFSGSSRKEYESVYLGGDFDRVLAGLARLRDRKRAAGSTYPIIEVNSLAFRHHVRGLPRFVKLMAEHGVNQVNVTPLHEHANGIAPLVGHAAPPASLSGDRTAAKAELLAARLGMRLNIHPGLRCPPEVLRQPSRGRSEAEPAPPRKPKIPIKSFPALAKTLVVKPAQAEAGPPPQPIDPVNDSVDQVRVALRPERIRELAEHGQEFVCLEPFKSIYVRRNGEVKVCCFMQEDLPALGTIRSNPALEVWHGSGFRSVRHSMLNSEFPLGACGYCLLNQQAPDSHGIDVRAAEYAHWLAERYGSGDDVVRMDRAGRDLASLGEGKHIVARMVEAVSPLLLDDDTLARARRLLALLSSLDRARGPYAKLVEGYLDDPGPGSVTGWVWSPAFPELRIPVTCHVNGQPVAETVAHTFRADLLAAGKGDGRYGFGFKLDSAGLPPGDVTVSIFLGDTRCQLEGSPRKVRVGPPQT